MARDKGERFRIDVRVLTVEKRGSIILCTGEDGDGHEVAWTADKRESPTIGSTILVWGHDIHRYSGESGPWASGRRSTPR